jgi:hypothetical protein
MAEEATAEVVGMAEEGATAEEVEVAAEVEDQVKRDVDFSPQNLLTVCN